MYSAHFSDHNTGWVVGGNTILKTTNSGTNWIPQISGASYNLYSVYFTNINTGWVVGNDYITNLGTIVKTTNSGVNWISQASGTINSLYSVHFTDSNTGWIVGNSGTILKTTNGGTSVGVQNFSTEIPSGYSLSQNYPNPFNPVTNLEFGISDLGFVSLKVYDILGKEVVTLVNEKLSPGKYQVEFDGSGLPSGVYFYRLTAGEFTDTKRMMLIK
ncbi:MAG: T9SS type A sorting domain-containing protein [Ignavibacteria bacterium]|nr:T9SS type A sorting domain-containing protein [Ignavibacteria bacterium]